MPVPENSIYFGNLRRAAWVKAPAPGLDASSKGVSEQLDLANGGAAVASSGGSHREFDMAWPTGQESDYRFLNEYRDCEYGTGMLYWVDPMAMDVNVLPPHVARPELVGRGWPSILGAGQEPVMVGAGVFTTNLLPNPSFETAGLPTTVRTNLISNPSFENADATGWNAVNSATLVSQGTVARTANTYAAKATLPTQATPSVVGFGYGGGTLPAATTYTFSGYVYIAPGGVNVNIQVQSAVAGFVSVTGGVTNAFSTWQRLSVTFTTTAAGFYSLYFLNSAAATAGQIFYVDDILLEVSSVLGSYFDGNTATAADFSYYWTATSGLSTSIQQGLSVVGTVVNPTEPTIGVYRSNAHISSDGYSVAFTSLKLSTNPGIQTDIYLQPGTYTQVAKVWIEPGTLVGGGAVSMVQQGAGVTPSSPTTTVTGQWVELRATFTVSTAVLVPTFIYISGANMNAGKTVWVDDAMIVAVGGYTGQYFDGSTQYADGRQPIWNGAPDASTSTIYNPYAGMPFLAAKYSMTVPAGAVAQRKTVLIIPDTHALWVGFSGVAAGGGVVRVQPILRDGSYALPQDLVLLSDSANIRLNTSFSGATYSAVLIYLTQTVAGTASVTLTSAKAVYSLIGSTPDLTGTHVRGLGHSGLRISSGPTLAYTYYNGDAGKKYVSASAKFTEVGSWI